MLKYFQEILLLKYTYYANTFKDILISNIHTHKYNITHMQNTYTTYIISKNILISKPCIQNTHIIHSISIDIFISNIHIHIYFPTCISTWQKKKKKVQRRQ